MNQLGAIQATDLLKRYGGLVAVDGVSFDLKRGETFGLLGPNGAGKTTTIHMLVGALRPDGGDIVFDGEPDPTRAEVRRRIGLAPQDLALYDDLTGAENLRFYARLYGLRGRRLKDRVAWALAFAGLEDRGKDQVKKYSGGMQRRLNLACGLVHEPSLLLLDEPTVGVDPQSRNHIFESIEALRRDGLTVLYTTHYMDEAQRMCDRVAVMDRGKILDVGTVDELVERHGGKTVVVAEADAPPSPDAWPEATVDGHRIRVETNTPLEVVSRLIQGADPIRELRIHRPDLETVFLTLTGRRLRD